MRIKTIAVTIWSPSEQKKSYTIPFDKCQICEEEQLSFLPLGYMRLCPYCAITDEDLDCNEYTKESFVNLRIINKILDRGLP